MRWKLKDLKLWPTCRADRNASAPRLVGSQTFQYSQPASLPTYIPQSSTLRCVTVGRTIEYYIPQCILNVIFKITFNILLLYITTHSYFAEALSFCNITIENYIPQLHCTVGEHTIEYYILQCILDVILNVTSNILKFKSLYYCTVLY